MQFLGLDAIKFLYKDKKYTTCEYTTYLVCDSVQQSNNQYIVVM